MADKIIREKGDKELYTCASGITPSGTVHIGNFREIITVELVVRALREKGRNVRFIYSWDDYDVFRKVPRNMPDPELLEKYLRFPITLVPDTTGRAENYARGNEKAVEDILPAVGVHPEYLYQAERYRSNRYAEDIRHALEHRDEIRAIFETEQPTEDDVVKALGLIQRTDAIQRCLSLADGMAHDAVACLDVLPDSVYKSAFVDVADYVIRRTR